MHVTVRCSILDWADCGDYLARVYGAADAVSCGACRGARTHALRSSSRPRTRTGPLHANARAAQAHRVRCGARGRTRGKLVLALQTAAQGQALSEGNERAREDRRIFKPVPALAMSRCATRPVPEPRTPHTCWACPHAKEFSLREHGGRGSAASTVLLPASALASAVAPMSPMRGPISNGMQTVCNLLCSAKGHVVGAQAFVSGAA